MKTKLKLITMSEIQTEEVRWLWYPYIPFGKITIIQGDPGEGKTTGVKSAYRGLGSIDFRAAARSVLLVGRSKDDSNMCVVVHVKSSLAPEGQSILFSLNSESGFTWNGFCDTTASELLSTNGPSVTKTEQAEKLILEMLGNGEVASDKLLHRSSALGISERTLKIAKQNLGVSAIRRGDHWYVQIAESMQEGKGVTC